MAKGGVQTIVKDRDVNVNEETAQRCLLPSALSDGDSAVICQQCSGVRHARRYVLIGTRGLHIKLLLQSYFINFV